MVGLVNCRASGFGFISHCSRVVSLVIFSKALKERYIQRISAPPFTECRTMNMSVDGPSPLSDAKRLHQISFNISASETPFLLSISSTKVVCWPN